MFPWENALVTRRTKPTVGVALEVEDDHPPPLGQRPLEHTLKGQCLGGSLAEAAVSEECRSLLVAQHSQAQRSTGVPAELACRPDFRRVGPEVRVKKVKERRPGLLTGPHSAFSGSARPVAVDPGSADRVAVTTLQKK